MIERPSEVIMGVSCISYNGHSNDFNCNWSFD